ncbi:MAG: hypothetical protein P9L92_17460 [Candidatus Electryonea clarkiae]|nr:hypothetical protein [Candidatus Electryonea clarkiae]
MSRRYYITRQQLHSPTTGSAAPDEKHHAEDTFKIPEKDTKDDEIIIFSHEVDHPDQDHPHYGTTIAELIDKYLLSINKHSSWMKIAPIAWIVILTWTYISAFNNHYFAEKLQFARYLDSSIVYTTLIFLFISIITIIYLIKSKYKIIPKIIFIVSDIITTGLFFLILKFCYFNFKEYLIKIFYN